MLDLNWREVAIFAPMIAIVLWMGIYPESFLRPIRPSIANLADRVEKAKAPEAARLMPQTPLPALTVASPSPAPGKGREGG
jgi:NADH-quinone oxidoreductase subunit M